MARNVVCALAFAAGCAHEPAARENVGFAAFAATTPRETAIWSDAIGGTGVTFESAQTFDRLNNVGVFLTDTRIAHWNGVAWTEVLSSMPTSFNYPSITFHDRLNVSIIAAGDGGAVFETWSWNGATLTQLFPTVSPPRRRSAAMAYDAGRDRVVLFSGFFSPGPSLADTWEWDGATWEQKSPSTSPPNGVGSMVYDRSRGAVSYFRQSATRVDVWTWDGSQWTLRSPATLLAPSPRNDFAVAFDEARGEALLFGGQVPNAFIADLWAWNGSSWTYLGEHPPARRRTHSMGFDAVRKLTLVAGGYVDGETFTVRLRGGACTVASQCSSGHCVDGTCCESAACGPCQTCAGSDPGLCSPVASAPDPDSCFGANVCNARSECVASVGTSCTSDAQCLSTFCRDGVCCDRTCTGTCEACRQDLKVEGASGVCGASKDGSDPHDDCGQSVVASCQFDGACDGAGRCRRYARGLACGAVACQGNRSAGELCDGLGSCVASPEGVDCAPYACDGATGACLAACDRDADCDAQTGTTCDPVTHTCAARPSDARCETPTLRRAVDGTTTSCEPYLCVAGECRNTCRAVTDCAFPNACSQDYRCVPPADGSALDNDGGCRVGSPGTSLPPLGVWAALAASAFAVRRKERAHRAR